MIKKRFGRIVFISSVVAHTGNPGQVNYAASKAAISGIVKSLALELAGRNITVNSIAPGFIESNMTNKLNDDQKKIILDKIPMKKLGNPEDIANSVGFLCSDNASYITGQTIHVNGGLVLI
jgi:3-oxoacyl-[acyl-carrier protein] reductase